MSFIFHNNDFSEKSFCTAFLNHKIFHMAPWIYTFEIHQPPLLVHKCFSFFSCSLSILCRLGIVDFLYLSLFPKLTLYFSWFLVLFLLFVFTGIILSVILKSSQIIWKLNNDICYYYLELYFTSAHEFLFSYILLNWIDTAAIIGYGCI